MAGVVPHLVLNTGAKMPRLGLGTFQATKPGEVKAAVKAAVVAGYRLIDCAAGYGNQAEIGEALTELVAEKVVTRDELFLVSKLFQTHHAGEQAGADGDSRCTATLEQTLSELQTDYVDLFLIHWPFGFGEIKLEKPPGTKQPLRLPDGSPNPIWSIKMEYLATWRAMEAFVKAGKCKAIGVSNFTAAQLQHLVDVAEVPPAVNQVEVHPYHSQQPLQAFSAEKGIVTMGYSPLGSAADRHPAGHDSVLLKHPVVAEVAAEAGKSAGQVLIRWTLQKNANLVSIPKSSNAGRIAQNFDVTSWTLSEGSMAKLDALNCDFRYFISYLKKPDNDVKWHDDVIETGTDADWVR